MGKRISSWYASATRIVRNWFLDLIDRTGCRRAEKRSQGDNRCAVLNAHCENLSCEKLTLGRFGSPGPVKDSEKLYRILIAPTDVGMSAEQIVMTAITHSETIGMSVLRGDADDQEFRKIVEQRVSKPGRTFVAVTELDCGILRSFRSAKDESGRNAGDRHLIVVDTDMAGLPHHADVFNTVVRKSGSNPPTDKAVWRRERNKLLDLANNNIIKRQQFRDGRI
jgi:hypothetical protein